jgi:hypothetical protein
MKTAVLFLCVISQVQEAEIIIAVLLFLCDISGARGRDDNCCAVVFV